MVKLIVLFFFFQLLMHASIDHNKLLSVISFFKFRMRTVKHYQKYYRASLTVLLVFTFQDTRRQRTFYLNLYKESCCAKYDRLVNLLCPKAQINVILKHQVKYHTDYSKLQLNLILFPIKVNLSAEGETETRPHCGGRSI